MVNRRIDGGKNVAVSFDFSNIQEFCEDEMNKHSNYNKYDEYAVYAENDIDDYIEAESKFN